MKNYTVWSVVVLAAIIILLLWISNSSYVAPVSEPGALSNPPVSAPNYFPTGGLLKPVIPIENQANYVVDITTAGFSPGSLTVKKGDSVIWTNRDKERHQLMADAKDSYPEKGDCGSKLNSCQPLNLGDSFRVVFNERGMWKYYDKLNTKFSGTVTVE